MSIAKSLTEVVKLRGKVVHLSLQKSMDLVCTNMMCEKVTEACICRLERSLQKMDTDTLLSVDLRDNALTQLPPSLVAKVSLDNDTKTRWKALQSIDLRGNSVNETDPIVVQIRESYPDIEVLLQDEGK
jgi:hypothetical protein